MKQFLEVKRQIANIAGEITATQATDFYPSGGDQDLTLRRLEEYNAQLQKLQRERVGNPSFWEINIQCDLQVSRLQGLLW
jgi:protein regulator of cytokinesis 1